jgi:hypothetical protein
MYIVCQESVLNGVENMQDGKTALHLALSSGSTAVAQLLLARGASTAAKDKVYNNYTIIGDTCGAIAFLITTSTESQHVATCSVMPM